MMSLPPIAGLDADAVSHFVQSVLKEDLGLGGDVTTDLTIPADARLIATIQTREQIAVAGIDLAQVFFEALDPDVRVLAVATRPDCLSHETVELLRRLNQIKPVWIELGLQTIHPQTARYIRRGYPLEVFDDAVARLKAAGIQVITHVILFLPGETEAQMLKTIDYLNRNPIDGIKLQLLHILKGTDLARDYARSPFHIPDMDEYIRCIGNCIAHLRPDIVIHRLTGDGPKDLLIEPQWTGAKRTVLNHIHQYLKEQDIWQGKEYYG